MKKTIFILLCMPVLGAFAQTDSSLAKYYRLDFAIPQHPGLSILDDNSDNILRPGNTQELFSVITSGFFSGTTPILPKNLSFEFAPSQLVGINKITLSDYRNNDLMRILYDAKISVGARTKDNENLQNLGLGIRFTWVDKTSLSKNKEFISEAIDLLSRSAELHKNFEKKLMETHTLIRNQKVTKLALGDSLFQESVDSAFRLDPEIIGLATQEQFRIEALREKYKEVTWNKLKFESAFALKYSSPDSLVHNIHYSKFEIYNTLALPLGKATKSHCGWGQLLIGLNVSSGIGDSIRVITDSAFTITDTVRYKYSSANLSGRIYAGSNGFKTFLEGSCRYQNGGQVKATLNGGAEFNVRDGIWAALLFGNSWTSPPTGGTGPWKSDWFWRLSLKFHLPETKKI
ncbi:MAG: hypothetical protein ACJ77K_07795 [Bacteroidia bacterium]